MSHVLYSNIKQFLPRRALDNQSSVVKPEPPAFQDPSGGHADIPGPPNVHSAYPFTQPSESWPDNAGRPNPGTSESWPGIGPHQLPTPAAAPLWMSGISLLPSSTSTTSTVESTSTATSTQSSSSSSATEHPATTTPTGISALPAGATEAAPSHSHGGLAAKTVAAIVVPVVLGTLLLLAAAIFSILWWRRKMMMNRNANAEDEFDADVSMSQPARGLDDVPYTGPIPRRPASQSYRFVDAASAAESRRLMGAPPHPAAAAAAAASAAPAVAVDPPPEDTATAAPPPARSAPLTEENLAVLHRGNSRAERPQSPFDDPPEEDSVSAISDLERPVGGGGYGPDGDEVSSVVSSLDDDEQGGRIGSRGLRFGQ
ncbi:hypothetical protein VTN02DRAFT_371 [Thermoascus thermophilus]